MSFRESERQLFTPRTKGSKAGKIYYSKAAADQAVGRLFSQGWHEAYIIDLGGGKYRVVKRPGSTRNSTTMAKKAKKKKKATKARRPAKKNTSRSSKKRTAKRPNAAKHSKKKKAARRPNPTRALQSKIGQMVPGRFYDTTLSGAKVRMKRVGQSLVIRPKAKRK